MELGSQESTFLTMIKIPCIEISKTFSILPSVMASFGILISNWGTTKEFFKTRNIFNLLVDENWFGKCYSPMSGKIYDSVKECPEIGATLIRVYDDHQKSVKDFIEYLATVKRSKNGPLKYSSIFGCTDYKETVYRLVRAGFLKDYLNKPDDIVYINSVINTIEDNGLYLWDKEENNNV